MRLGLMILLVGFGVRFRYLDVTGFCVIFEEEEFDLFVLVVYANLINQALDNHVWC